MNIYSTRRWYVGSKIMRGSGVSRSSGRLCPEGSGKGRITLTFQRFVILDATTQRTGSVKVKTDQSRRILA